MENMQGEKLVAFTEEDRREAIRECFPELTEEEGIARFTDFLRYIILK